MSGGSRHPWFSVAVLVVALLACGQQVCGQNQTEEHEEPQAQEAQQEQECQKIDAAFYDAPSYLMYFIYNGEVIGYNENYETVSRQPVAVLNFPSDEEITAITASSDSDGHFYIYSNTTEEEYSAIGEKDTEGEPIIYYTPDFTEAFGPGEYRGINAAMYDEEEEVYYYFSGCKFVTVLAYDHLVTGEAGDMSSLGLPCDVDAALYTPLWGSNVIIKGNMIWIYDADSQMYSGPIEFKDLFFDLDLNLCPL